MKMDAEQFKKSMLADGFECREFSAEAHTHNPSHTHPWHASLFILDGELILTTPEGTKTFGPGENCEVPANTQHSEMIGNAPFKALLATKQP